MKLYDFLILNEEKIVKMTEDKALDLAGTKPSSEQLKRGLPIFYKQLIEILKRDQLIFDGPKKDTNAIVNAASRMDEYAMALASGRPDEAELAKSAGSHGTELLRLGYTLSHVVHAYGAMCQSITELATQDKVEISSSDFQELNHCLDIAIAGAVTEFQLGSKIEEKNRELQHLGALAHELRNALTSVNLSIQLLKKGTVGFGGSTAQILDKSLKRLEFLIDRSLTEVRLQTEPIVNPEKMNLLKVIDEIMVTADIEARAKKQVIKVQIDPELEINVDPQLFFSAMSNVIQNAVKYSKSNGVIQIRAKILDPNLIIEVEDECGGIIQKKNSAGDSIDLFSPFEQQHYDRSGLGLGLTISKRAILLNHGTLEYKDIEKKGCIFKVVLPKV